MKNEAQHIGNLFKTTLENYQIEPEEGDWIILDQKLNKMKFFKFSLFNFNIYYSLFIFGTFLLSSALFIKSFNQKNEIEPKNNKASSVVINKIAPKDATENKVKSNKESTPKEKTEKPSRLIINKSNSGSDGNTVKSSINSNISNSKKKDSSLTINTEAPPLHPDKINNTSEENTLIKEKENKEKLPKKKKIVYISKQDTVIVYDTLSRKKSFRKR